jgi:predicted TIM-barrel fold metal-dependent hydrolase
MTESKLISADSHVNEPGDLWVERIDKQFRERAPRVVENPSGLRHIMWSSDYPHTVSTWPHSREVVERDFKGVPESEKRQIVRENVARLYGLALT